MSHFTLQLGPDGPMVVAYARPSEGRAKALEDAGQAVTPWKEIRALVDTGASCTCLDPTVLNALGLTPTGTTTVYTAGNVPEERAQYDIALAIPGKSAADPVLVIPTIAVVATALLDLQGFHALIGRDILARCTLHYNGSEGTFTISY